jgi:hypothetical protein
MIDFTMANVRFWPHEDEAELVEVARWIEARRKDVYVTDDGQAW